MELIDFKNEVARENNYEDWGQFVANSTRHPFREHDEAAERYAQHRYLIGKKTGTPQPVHVQVDYNQKPFISRIEGAALRGGKEIHTPDPKLREGEHFQLDMSEIRKISSRIRELPLEELSTILNFEHFRCTFMAGVPLLKPINPWDKLEFQTRHEIFELFAAENILIFVEGEEGKEYHKRFFINVAYRYCRMPAESEENWIYCSLEDYKEKAADNAFQCQKVYTKKLGYYERH